MTDIKSSNLEDNKGFKLDFYFEENPYFKNTMVFFFTSFCCVVCYAAIALAVFFIGIGSLISLLEFIYVQLSKTYHMIDDDEPILERAVG